MMLASTVDFVNLGIGPAAVLALLGYSVVFFGLILLMLVVTVMGKFFIAKEKKTAEKTAAQIKKELYDLACNASVTAAGEKVYINVSGLSENMEAALAIIEDKIANAKGDDAVLANYKANMFRQRANSKTNQRACYSMLTQYVNYGKNNPATYVLSNSEIQALTSEQLLDEIRNALGCS